MKNIPPPKRILFTRDGYQKVLNEKETLLSERPEAVTQLSEARNMGDLSENGYYKAARARLSRIDGRLRHLEKLIRLGKIIEKQSNDTVSFGSTVVLSDKTGNLEYTVVGSNESDPQNHTVSYMSPIGKAVMHKKAGDEVTILAPTGPRRMHLVSVK